MAVKLSALKVGDVLYQACPVAHRRRYWTYKVTAVGERFAEYRGGDGVEYVGGEETLRLPSYASTWAKEHTMIASLTFRQEVTGFGHRLARIYEQENGTFLVRVQGIENTVEAPTLRAARREAKDLMERLYSAPRTKCSCGNLDIALSDCPTHGSEPQEAQRALMVRALDAIAGWEATLIDDEPESRRIARNTLHKLGLSPKGYKHETKREWTRRRRAEAKRKGST